MIVVDASVVVAGLLNEGPARDTLNREPLHAPHLLDSEVVHAFRRLNAASRLSDLDAEAALRKLGWMAVTRYTTVALLERIWQLRHNLTTYDGTYVALAETLGLPLVTTDARLSGAPGMRCPVTVLPG